MRDTTIKILTNTLLLATTLISFNACGGAGDSDKVSIEITEICNAQKDSSGYQLLQKGDIISNTETLHTDYNTSNIKIYHNEKNEKKVCIKSGKAYIIR